MPTESVRQGPRHLSRRDLRRDHQPLVSPDIWDRVQRNLDAQNASDANDRQRRKLLQAQYDDAIASDLSRSEQQRVTREMETTNGRLAALDQVFADIEETLDRALQLGQDCHRSYRVAGPKVRRLMNQAFQALYITDEDTVRSDLAEPFAILLGEELTSQAEVALGREAGDPSSPTRTGPDMTSGPHSQHVEGLNKALLVGAEGLEPPTPGL